MLRVHPHHLNRVNALVSLPSAPDDLRSPSLSLPQSLESMQSDSSSASTSSFASSTYDSPADTLHRTTLTDTASTLFPLQDPSSGQSSRDSASSISSVSSIASTATQFSTSPSSSDMGSVDEIDDRQLQEQEQEQETQEQQHQFWETAKHRSQTHIDHTDTQHNMHKRNKSYHSKQGAETHHQHTQQQVATKHDAQTDSRVDTQQTSAVTFSHPTEQQTNPHPSRPNSQSSPRTSDSPADLTHEDANTISAPNTNTTHSASDSIDRSQITTPELHGKYKLVRYLGSGSYGHVHVAEHLTTGQQVAIKKIVGIFDNFTNAKRLLREIKILRILSHHNVIAIREILPPIHIDSFNELCVVFEFVETDLQKLIHSDQPFTNDHVQYFLYQLLCGVKYIHSANIIHRDLKPANVLVNSDCSLKICDFGLARSTYNPATAAPPVTSPTSSGTSAATSLSSSSLLAPSLVTQVALTPIVSASSSKPSLTKRTSLNSTQVGLNPPSKLTRELTKHVVTRWYRAPELILLSEKYTAAIDMWSIGCILAELLMIFDVLGTPSAADIGKIENDKARAYLRGLPPKSPIDFPSRYPGADPRALEILTHLLTFDPDKRLTAAQALDHPYLYDLRLESEEKCFPEELAQMFWSEFAFEDKPVTKEQIKALIKQEILAAQAAHNGQQVVADSITISLNIPAATAAAESEQEEISTDVGEARQTATATPASGGKRLSSSPDTPDNKRRKAN